MAGCFGGSAIDRYMEGRLHDYLDSLEPDGAGEWAEENFGDILLETSDVGTVYESGYGTPVETQGYDEDGPYLAHSGVTEACVHENEDGTIEIHEGTFQINWITTEELNPEYQKKLEELGDAKKIPYYIYQYKRIQVPYFKMDLEKEVIILDKEGNYVEATD